MENHITIKVIVQTKILISIVQEICTTESKISKICYLEIKKVFNKKLKQTGIIHLKKIHHQLETIKKQIYHHHVVRMQN